MPKGRPKKEDTQMISALQDLTAVVRELKEKVENLGVVQATSGLAIAQSTSEPSVQPLPEFVSSTPVPVEYREIVDNVLNRNFGIQIEPFKDSPQFMFTIVVPEKYSNMNEAQKSIQKVDLRTRVISYAEGSNGIRDWSQRVFENLNPQLQSLVVADKVIP